VLVACCVIDGILGFSRGEIEVWRRRMSGGLLCACGWDLLVLYRTVVCGSLRGSNMRRVKCLDQLVSMNRACSLRIIALI